MQYTKLGNSDLNVSKVCIGCKMSQIALDVTLTPEEVEYLEELYVPHTSVVRPSVEAKK